MTRKRVSQGIKRVGQSQGGVALAMAGKSQGITKAKYSIRENHVRMDLPGK